MSAADAKRVDTCGVCGGAGVHDADVHEAHYRAFSEHLPDPPPGEARLVDRGEPWEGHAIDGLGGRRLAQPDMVEAIRETLRKHGVDLDANPRLPHALILTVQDVAQTVPAVQTGPVIWNPPGVATVLADGTMVEPEEQS